MLALPYMGDKAMTIVMAMYDTDGTILVGTDSQATEEDGLKSQVQKVKSVAPDVPVIWSCAGNPAIGAVGFSDWLGRVNFKNINWLRFAKEASKIWSELNGEQRERCRSAGITLDVNNEMKYLSDGLLAGWLHGKPAMFGLSSDGNLDPYTTERERLFAVGTGAPVAKAVFLSMFHVQQIKARVKIMETALITASNFAPNCGPPIEIWRITPDAVVQVLKVNVRLEFEEQLETGSNGP